LFFADPNEGSRKTVGPDFWASAYRVPGKATMAPDQESLRLAARLREDMDGAAHGERVSLARAKRAGKIVHEVKSYLRDNPLFLKNFKQWFAAHMKGYDRSTADIYETIYIHTSNPENKGKTYRNIKDVLCEWRLSHPKRKRFTPLTKEQKAAKALALKEEAMAAARAEVREEVKALAKDLVEIKAKAEVKRQSQVERRDVLATAPPGPPKEFAGESPGAGLLRLSEITQPGEHEAHLAEAYGCLAHSARNDNLRLRIQADEEVGALLQAVWVIAEYWMPVAGCEQDIIENCGEYISTILNPDDDPDDPDPDDEPRPTPPDEPTPTPHDEPTPPPPETTWASLRHRITEGDCFQVLGRFRRSHAGQVQLGLTSSPYPGRFEDYYRGCRQRNSPSTPCAGSTWSNPC
jgi:hypothetical protein